MFKNDNMFMKIIFFVNRQCVRNCEENFYASLITYFPIWIPKTKRSIEHSD